jgi:hypothetical protein
MVVSLRAGRVRRPTASEEDAVRRGATFAVTPPRSFGVFAPVGYVVLGFPGQTEAAKARQALLTGGYEEDEVMAFSSQQVISDIESTRGTISPLAYLGATVEHQEQHLACAKQGCAFLVVYAPTEPETARVMSVARRFGARFAHKYNRLTVEEIL